MLKPIPASHEDESRSLVISGPNLVGGYTVRLFLIVGRSRFMRWSRVPAREFRQHGVIRGLHRVFSAAIAAAER